VNNSRTLGLAGTKLEDRSVPGATSVRSGREIMGLLRRYRWVITADHHDND
jgi:hypothetical protein